MNLDLGYNPDTHFKRFSDGKIIGRAGNGKWSYASQLKCEEQLRLLETAKSPEIVAASQMRVLYDSIVRSALHAIDLCKGNQKDSARNWHRFFSQASIVSILEASGHIEHSKLVDLRLLLLQLRDSCHPEERLSLETDIQHIRQNLEKLLELAQQSQSPVFPLFNPVNRLQSEN